MGTLYGEEGLLAPPFAFHGIAVQHHWTQLHKLLHTASERVVCAPWAVTQHRRLSCRGVFKSWWACRGCHWWRQLCAVRGDLKQAAWRQHACTPFCVLLSCHVCAICIACNTALLVVAAQSELLRMGIRARVWLLGQSGACNIVDC